MPLKATYETALKKDLCVTCIHCNWYCIPHMRFERIQYHELAKRCYAQKGLRGLFRKDISYFGVAIEKVVVECDKYSNATFRGWSPNPNNYHMIVEECRIKNKELREIPKIDTGLAEANPPEKGKSYQIIKAEPTQTDIRSYSAIRVCLHEVKKKAKGFEIQMNEENQPVERITMLWVREAVGEKSKLGAFLVGFKDFFVGTEHEEDFNDTDLWIDHIIHIKEWQERDRDIKVLA